MSPDLDISDFSLLPQNLRDVLAGAGINSPTPIQAKAIPAVLSERDLLAQSQTGSGKTLAFVLPMAIKLEKHGKLRALVLTPTRELATQVAGVFKTTLSVMGLRALAITGGASYYRQKHELDCGVDVVIGTPGRICDLLDQGVLNLSELQFFVLDEVDQMLDIGFANELENIRTSVPSGVRTLLFSATLSSEIKVLARKLLNNPVEILVNNPKDQAPSTINHVYFEVRDGAEKRALINALLYYKPEQALIFCKTRLECSDLTEAFSVRGFNAAALHGDLSQQERNHTMERFRSKSLQYLVSTNVAARGIDVQNLPVVVNYSVPTDVESYTHRVGRTGRNGAEGSAWTFITPRSCRSYEYIIRSMKIVPQKMEVPSASAVAQKTADVYVGDLLRKRDLPINRNVEKAVDNAISNLSVEDKSKLLGEMLARQLEKLGSYHHDDLIVFRPIFRLEPTSSAPNNRFNGDNGGFRRRSSNGFSDRSHSGGSGNSYGRSSNSDSRSFRFAQPRRYEGSRESSYRR